MQGCLRVNVRQRWKIHIFFFWYKAKLLNELSQKIYWRLFKIIEHFVLFIFFLNWTWNENKLYTKNPFLLLFDHLFCIFILMWPKNHISESIQNIINICANFDIFKSIEISIKLTELKKVLFIRKNYFSPVYIHGHLFSCYLLIQMSSNDAQN